MKIFLLKIAILILKFIYFFFKLLPVSKKVVMISRQSNDVNLDFKLIGKELNKDCKVVYLCKKLENNKISYCFHMIRQMYHLATSKVCVLDSYSIAVSLLKHKKSLTVIQIWHSIGTMKRFGYTALGKEEGRNIKTAKALKMHNNYDIVFASSEAYVDHLKDGFNIAKEKIEIYTLPRVDLLKNKKYEEEAKNKIYNKYPIIAKKKNIVYCPTFRKDETDFQNKLNELIAEIDYKKYNLIVKLHPLSKTVINDSKVIVDKNFSSFDFLFVADKVITDYSCILYEAGIRNIPIYFYAYDLEEYTKKRGIALDYKTLPGYTEKTAKDLVNSFNKKYDYAYLKEFINTYVTNTNNCTSKIVKKIKKYL